MLASPAAKYIREYLLEKYRDQILEREIQDWHEDNDEKAA